MTSSAIWQRAVHSEIWLVGARGRLDQRSVSHFEDILEQLLAEGWIYLVVDLSEVSYVNSGGLRVLVSTWRRLRKQGGQIHLAGLSRRVQEIFEMVQFHEIFRTFATADDAVGAIIDSWHD
jgi:anti-sigma B factor antagonist